MGAGAEAGTKKIAESGMPTKYGIFRAIAYEDASSGVEHLALVFGDIGTCSSVLVRIHSECLTGEALGSLRCDCGEQLDTAFRLIVAEGAGCLLYLRGQEGRSIGLGNKIAAYALQDCGVDTLDANERLGLPADSRDYGSAASMLDDLGISAVNLLTNNPQKVAALDRAGIRVTTRRSLICAANTTNAVYLATKKSRFGHLL